MEDFKISLISTKNVFYANSEVNGIVCLKTEKPLKARKIHVSINGRAKAKFHHQRGKHTYHYSSTQFYIQEEFILWECKNGSNKIPAGNYQFPFKFKIPINAPKNITEEYGNIRYFIKANINVPWSFDKSVILEFSVFPFIDLNVDSRLAEPVINYLEKSGAFSSKAVKITLKMPKMGYVCGETISIHVSIENESKSEIKSVESGIYATYIFTATDESVFSKHTMSKEFSKKYCVEDIRLPAEMSQNTVFIRDIRIPSIPPSLDHCDIIKLQYRVFIKVHTNALFSSGATAAIPIIIGTVPLQPKPSTTINNIIADPNYSGFESYPPKGIPPPEYDFKEVDSHEEDSENKKVDSFKFQTKSSYSSDS
uniref:Arrestin C-terminal-like domain-containing protein n=1 Tax=Panagrolaimus davidi TaxID=227884 RepID=A0A914PSW6_9BILA